MRTGRALRDEGMQRALFGAEMRDPEWPGRALDIVEQLARQRRSLTSEDVRAAAARTGLAEPHELRAWGPVMMMAAKKGWIERWGWATSSNPLAHQRPVALWRSRIYDGNGGGG